MAIAGSGQALGASIWWGAALLLAYGLGHNVLLLGAGATPGATMAMARRFEGLQTWLPGRHSFAALLGLAGAWLLIQGLSIVDWLHESGPQENE